MIADALISQIQLALIGIVVVFGLFFVWRSLHRMEDKLDRFLDGVSKGGSCLPGSNTCAFGWNGEDMPLPDDADEAAAEEFMRTVFGAAPGGPVMFSAPTNSSAKDPVVIEEIAAPAEELHPPQHVPASLQEHVMEDHGSEADTDLMNPLSKSKLKKMNLDTLKELCKERGLSTEGSKSVLTDRLLGLVRD